ncbi:DUF6538 domain-containing protein [Hyphobacterium vulgare]|uniref:DUF6538 domain-containing protein n=1 Tax=Hyphobacterium vulgare TaxID=1736751 RepID=UPI0036D3EF73
MTGLKREGDWYHFRRTVPPDLREIVGKREWKRSLGLKVGDELRAAARARALWKETEAQIAELREKIAHRDDPARLAKEAGEWAAEFELLEGQRGSVRETVLHERGMEALDSQRDLAIDHIIEAAGKKFGWDEEGRPRAFTPEQEAKLAVLEAGKPVSPPLTIARARDLYIQDRYAGKRNKAVIQGVGQFIDLAGDLVLHDITRPIVIKWLNDLAIKNDQSKGTIKRRLGTLRAIFNHARDNYGLAGDNPFARQKVPDVARRGNPRVPFHKVHYSLLDRHLQTGKVADEQRLILTLLRYTGCRPSEIGGLSRSEVYLDTDVPVIRVRWTEDRRVKTGSSERIVPLVGPALDACKEAVERSRSEALFSERYQNTDRLSQALMRVIHRAGIPKTNRRLVIYSFRHSIKEALRLAGVADELQDALMGHTSNHVGRGYGAQRRPASVLSEAMAKAHPLLGEVDETEYLPGELPDPEFLAKISKGASNGTAE